MRSNTLTAITLAAAFVLAPAAPATAQSEAWPGPGNRVLTVASGCLISWPTVAPAPRSIAWSGPCTAGEPVDGSGTLTMVLDDPQNELTIRGDFSGAMVSGYFNGSVTRVISANGVDGPPLTTTLNMGCEVGSASCVPGVAVDEEEEEGPTGYPTPAVRSGENGPVGPAVDLDHTSCVDDPVVSQTGGPANTTYRATYTNLCPYAVNVLAPQLGVVEHSTGVIEARGGTITFECSSGKDNSGCRGFGQHSSSRR
jgi:hypothetical protein